MLKLLAEEPVSIPLGFDNWLLNLIAVISIGVLLIHAYRLLQPKPAMERQLAKLQEKLLDRLDQQDNDMIARMSELRTHIDTETTRIHDRVTAHGQELFRLKGFVDGLRTH